MGKYNNRLITSAEKSTILLYGEVGELGWINSLSIKEEIMEAEASGKPIEIRINSHGGDVFTGIAIVEAINASKGDITIFIDGLAASIASVIALCGKPLYMGRYSRLMLHNVSTHCHGNKEDMLRCFEEIKRIEALLCSIISKRCNKTTKEIQGLYFDGNDHWITAEEALGLGLVDGIFETDSAVQNPTLEEIYEFTNKSRGISPKGDYKAFKNRLKTVLSLDKSTDEGEILNSINSLLQDSEKANRGKMLGEAISKGWIRKEEKGVFLSLAEHDKVSFTALYERYKAEDKEAVKRLISNAKEQGKIMPLENALYTDIGNRMGANVLGDLLGIKARPRMASRFLSLDFNDRSGWSIDDWRNFDPEGLAKNPALYDFLMDKEGMDTGKFKSLEWYRKNNPKYLEENPEFYKELLRKELNNKQL